jgi:hypothetical protein
MDKNNSGTSATAKGSASGVAIIANRNVPKEAGQGSNNVKISKTRKGGDMNFQGAK